MAVAQFEYGMSGIKAHCKHARGCVQAWDHRRRAEYQRWVAVPRVVAYRVNSTEDSTIPCPVEALLPLLNCGGAAVAGIIEERAEIPARARMCTVAPDDRDVGIAYLVIAPEHIERTRAREQQRKIVRGLR